jgi:hypothetical protein
VPNTCLFGNETGDLSECVSTTGNVSSQSAITRGPWSTYALQCNPTATGVGSAKLGGRATNGTVSTFASAGNPTFVRVYLYIGTLPASASEEFLTILTTGSGTSFTLRVTSAGNIASYINGTTLLATGTAVLATGTWYRIEGKFGSGAGAVCEWKVATAGITAASDGPSVVDGSTTATASSTAIGFIVVGKNVDRNGNSVNFIFDDLIVSTTAYPGAGQHKCLLPNAAGNYQTWVIGAGSGSNYQVVNGRPPVGDTSYLDSTTIGNAETEGMTDSGTAGITGIVNSVMAIATVRRSGASAGSAKVRFRSGTTDTDALAYAVTATYILIGRIFDVDPNTSASWIVGSIDSVEAGMVQESSTVTTRMTFTAVFVDYTPGISFDAASNSGYQSPSSSYSWNHTCTGTNLFLAVDVEVLSVPGTTVSSITYNGVNLTLIGTKSSVSGAAHVECWGLVAPATGTHSIAVTLSASVASAGTASSYQSVNQTSPTEAFNGNQATNVGAADATVTITSASNNCWIHACVATDATAITANQTTRNNVTGTLGSGANEDTAGPLTPAGAQVMSYTGIGALKTWVIAGYAIRPVSDAALSKNIPMGLFGSKAI